MPIPDMLIAFGVFGETLNLNAQENPIKYKYFVIIAAILTITWSVGWLGYWWTTRTTTKINCTTFSAPFIKCIDYEF
ncbi:MAG: hypothetical protein V7K92_29195 [Nostoc sp.]|uniref:hypothetical protein n=1 Tax=Nostoc sp. TaxID=1180 RepID=UPI002FF3A4A4